MDDEEKIFTDAKVHTQIELNNYEIKTEEILKKAIDEVCTMSIRYINVDKVRLAKILQMENNLIYDDKDSILDNKEHKQWLYPSGKPIDEDRELEWKFWNNYKQNLMQKGWAPKIIDTIDEMTAKVLTRIDDPHRKGRWDRRGLVVGDVQSGKTANYTGLLCKAADAGYKVIVIFAGLHNSLRSQTQQRLDDDFIGFDSGKDEKNYRKSNRIGVGKILNHPVVHYVTTSNEGGDFSRAHAKKTGVQLASSDPKILIVKKNKSIINNLINWAGRMGIQEGQDKIKNIPLLVIDDECDNASINTKIVPRDENGKPIDEYDPTAINRGIRDFLSLFEQKSYVGYTATPFATILIHRQGEHKKIGDDLFPRDFIINLPKPNNYVGPERVFGINEDPDIGIERSIGYPLYQIIDDYSDIIPDRHKKILDVNTLPDSMKEAIRIFILSCSARRIRGQKTKHNSMLVHVSRYTNVQKQISELVNEEISTIKNRLKYGDGQSSDNLWNQLKELWESNFTPISLEMEEENLGEVHNWDDVRTEVIPSIEKLQVKELNGRAGDILEYKTYSDAGINVIAIGGDKLSRGLTLEGLTVSYYLRASRMYDTLMQMGRWFGFRDGYVDLCRIYTTDELISWYRHIALASVELRREFDYMVENGEKPIDYGMKIRSHPGVLSVTSLNKMRNGTRMRVTFDGYMAQTLFIDNTKDNIRNNFYSVENLIKKYSSEVINNVGFKFNNVHVEDIKNFLTNYNTNERNIICRPSYLIQYIDKLIPEGELIDWTVIVLSKKGGLKSKIKIKGIDDYLNLTWRTAFIVERDHVAFRRALLSPSHEKLDLTQSEQDELKRRGKESPKNIRACRYAKRGLLLLYPVHGNLEKREEIVYGNDEFPIFGYAISFPDSGKQREVEYIVDNLYPDELEAA
jgi:hypothetical protein